MNEPPRRRLRPVAESSQSAPGAGATIEQRIVEAVEQLLETELLKNIDVDRISRHADVSVEEFHRHFRSRDDLLQQLLSRRSDSYPQAERRRELILDALETLLATATLNQLDVEQIAAEAGIARTYFYEYFRSKTDALAALAARLGDSLREVYTRADTWFVDRPATMRPREALRQTITEIGKDWWPHRFVLREVSDLWGLPEPIRDTYLGAMDFASEQLRRGIERERERGVAPPGPDAAMLAQTLIWYAERNTLRAIGELPGALSWEDLVEVMTSVWTRVIYLDDDPPPQPRKSRRRSG